MKPDSRFTSPQVATIEVPPLRFRDITLSDVPLMRQLLYPSGLRTCDFTLGGIYMWIDYFHYKIAVVNDTLFIRGVSEDDVSVPAFSLPVGKMPMEMCVAMLRDYCATEGIAPLLSAVPEEAVDLLVNLGARSVTPLPQWADYVYDAHSLATLTGKKYNKKRNHVNRFLDENPGAQLVDITPGNLATVKQFLDTLHLSADKSVTAFYEQEQTHRLLDTFPEMGMEATALVTPVHGVVAFTIGEVVGDTLHLHVEKMRHDVVGAGETINKMMAALMLERHPEITLINRQDDSGDEGLRHAKESYHPTALMQKFNVLL